MKNSLKEVRVAKGFTQQQLSKLSGISQSHIALMEKGDRGIDFDNMEKLAQALGVKPYELLPKDWQPDDITPEEREILQMIRKSKAADNNTTVAKPKAG